MSLISWSTLSSRPFFSKPFSLKPFFVWNSTLDISLKFSPSPLKICKDVVVWSQPSMHEAGCEQDPKINATHVSQSISPILIRMSSCSLTCATWEISSVCVVKTLCGLHLLLHRNRFGKRDLHIWCPFCRPSILTLDGQSFRTSLVGMHIRVWNLSQVCGCRPGRGRRQQISLEGLTALPVQS